jgi:hypothetical protein
MFCNPKRKVLFFIHISLPNSVEMLFFTSNWFITSLDLIGVFHSILSNLFTS